ncbi:hypothetical protein IEZ26_17805 [Nocardioides cavernae]|uniref:Alpha/beta hydrolase n=1 Tax=Nocardioides cavernae TaxID=1921566 RepID=A0ABR8NEC3_9ACTN|nr:hypothetical protein [Nocardioides cavernae]MBD3926484.1 hypothetical protein [Nocardioides cavernae]MBM7512203.1 hypothetical protein [Nocardioides cavernae]
MSGEPCEQRLGILFVHGIGEQKRGESLVAWADPIHEFLRRLLTADDLVARQREMLSNRAQRVGFPKKDAEQDRLLDHEFAVARSAAAESALDNGDVPVRMGSTVLRQPEANEPAHLELSVAWPRAMGAATTEETIIDRSDWLLAESWWAEEFVPPPPGVMLTWALKVAPLIVLGHEAASWARTLQNPGKWKHRLLLRIPIGLFGYFLSILLLIGCLILLVALLALGSLPLPRVRQFAKRLSTRLASSVGDSYVLIASPSEYQAMVSRVQRDIAWLAKRCDRVAVVAHSQGAVVAHRALTQSAGCDVQLFVTVGSGLGKLTELEDLRSRGPAARLAWMVLAYALGGMVLSYVLSFWFRSGGYGFGKWLFLVNLFFYILLSLTIFWNLVQDRSHEQERRRRSLKKLVLRRNIRWIDFYSSSDPVPNGPLLDEEPQWLQSYQTWFEASWIRDHSGYRSNPDGFIAPLVMEMLVLESAGLRSLTTGLRVQVQTYARRRAWRCLWLIRARLIVLAAGAIAIPYHWPALSACASWLQRVTPERVGTVLAATVETLLVPKDANLHVDAILAAAIGAFALFLAFALTNLSWRRVGSRDLRRFYRGDQVDAGGYPAMLFAMVVSGLVIFPLSPIVLHRLRSASWWPADPAPWLLFAIFLLSTFFVTSLAAGADSREKESSELLSDLAAEPLVCLERWREQQFVLGRAAVALVLQTPLVGLFVWVFLHPPSWPYWLDLLVFMAACGVVLWIPLQVAQRMRGNVAARTDPWVVRRVEATVRPRGYRDVCPNPSSSADPASEGNAALLDRKMLEGAHKRKLSWREPVLDHAVLPPALPPTALVQDN